MAPSNSSALLTVVLLTGDGAIVIISSQTVRRAESQPSRFGDKALGTEPPI